MDGKEVHFTSSGDAIAAGLGMVHQHFMQVPSMTVAENLILGAETGSPFKVDRKKAVEITKELSEKYNLKVEAEEKVEDISLAMRQKLEILKALYRGAHILILDEPTAGPYAPGDRGAVRAAAALKRKRTYHYFYFS